ncbi:MAG TPA: hypothetical protein ENN33_13105 [Ignavibacteria bacterium]|nr:hypothetical protein [Ignavibacteria bacterium]
MKQSKISFSEEQIQFINKYSEMGFKDKSELVRKALKEYQKKVEEKELIESAKLYTKIYNADKDLRLLTDSAINEWPE